MVLLWKTDEVCTDRHALYFKNRHKDLGFAVEKNRFSRLIPVTQSPNSAYKQHIISLKRALLLGLTFNFVFIQNNLFLYQCTHSKYYKYFNGTPIFFILWVLNNYDLYYAHTYSCWRDFHLVITTFSKAREWIYCLCWLLPVDACP